MYYTIYMVKSTMSSFSVSSVPVMIPNQHPPFNSKLRSANFASNIWRHTFSVNMSSSQHASNLKRRSANYAPNIWHDTFLKYAHSESLGINEIMKQEVQMHKEKAAKICLFSNDNNISQKLSLIDSTQRLGISYYFENEIDKILTQIYNDFTNNNLAMEEGDLHFIALLFRLLRQKGYYISPDVFNKFKNRKGEFDETIVQDIQGIWSLYEAAQLRIHGENILEEAHEFTYNKLKSITNQLSSSLADQINQSLVQPLHKAIPRMRARSYIFFCEKNPSSHKKNLLNFAKLDFNMTQKLYQQEVGVAVRWWKKSEFITKFPYARERIAELYFWPFSMNSEPKYSSFRRVITKLVQWMTVVDETYGVYGTIEQLELFTQAIQRWDIGCIASLPECYKAIFNAHVELFDEMIELLNAVDGELDLVLQYLKKASGNYMQSYMVEAKWCHEGYIPTYNEYIYNVIEMTSTLYQALTIIFIAFGGFANKETLHWISNNIPPILQASSVVARLTNDLASHKFEQQRKHGASAVECCMNQYGFSQEEAYEFIKKDINNSWKDMNEEYLKLVEHIPSPILDCIINLARICEFLYANFEDKVTNCALFKDQIEALLLDPVVV